jgi:hypothetical protein
MYQIGWKSGSLVKSLYLARAPLLDLLLEFILRLFLFFIPFLFCVQCKATTGTHPPLLNITVASALSFIHYLQTGLQVRVALYRPPSSLSWRALVLNHDTFPLLSVFVTTSSPTSQISASTLSSQVRLQPSGTAAHVTCAVSFVFS